jgi:FAD/FMN-containing dehydrogenase
LTGDAPGERLGGMAALTLTGAVLRTGDAGYEDARRVFNSMIDRRPALIARCASTADVVAAVRHAREHDLPIAVHGGGHGVTGAAVCDDGVMIDLRGLSTVAVDPAARTVSCGGGTNWGQMDEATTAHGLVVPGGRVPTTGVGGLTLGSGSSWFERKFGLTCDSLLAAELVTADGEVVTASDDENAELFWGLRGGGGNFGVVTRFDFRAHPIPPLVFGGMLMFPHERVGDVLAHYRDFMAGAPDEVGGAAAFISAPPEEFVPEPVRGKPVFGLIVAYCGDPDEGRRMLAPLVEYGPPAVAMVDAMPYTAVQRLIEPGNPAGLRNYWSADFLEDLPDEAISVLAEHTARAPSPMTQVIILPGGGAVRRTPEDAMAFGERDAPWNIHFLAMWGDPADDERNIAWTRGLSRAMDAYKRKGRVYLNFIGDEGQERVSNAFGPEKWARLVALKDRWDPDNLFRLNQNIPPSGGR